MCGTLLTQGTHGGSARATACAIPDMETPNWRAVSAKASLRWVTLLRGRVGRDRRHHGRGGPGNCEPALCANMDATLPPSEFRVEGGEE